MTKKGKEKIVTAAFHLFLRNGYQGVSLKDIMASTKLSKGAIYHHFDSKYAIYLAALEEYFFKLLTLITTEDEELDFRSRVRLRYQLMANTISMVEQLSPDGIPFPIRTYYIFQLESEKDEKVRSKIGEALNHFRKEVISIVQSAIDRGEIKVDLPAAIIGYQILSMTEGLAIHHSALEKDGAVFLMKKYDEIIGAYLDLICSDLLFEAHSSKHTSERK